MAPKSAHVRFCITAWETAFGASAPPKRCGRAIRGSGMTCLRPAIATIPSTALSESGEDGAGALQCATVEFKDVPVLSYSALRMEGRDAYHPYQRSMSATDIFAAVGTCRWIAKLGSGKSGACAAGVTVRGHASGQFYDMRRMVADRATTWRSGRWTTVRGHAAVTCIAPGPHGRIGAIAARPVAEVASASEGGTCTCHTMLEHSFCLVVPRAEKAVVLLGRT
mmetsp:Transcript_12627/g.30067  ORF Transcript_12627/g.30067 Transcript_12627/m.30067 type:complete len:223 (+) Transcript_12627:1073-1741(+)